MVASSWVLVFVMGALPSKTTPNKASPGTAKAPTLRAKVTPSKPVAGNLQAASTIYAAAALEEAKVFAVVDALAELYPKGLLPVGEATGEALKRWADAEPFDAAQRARLYSHVLGVGTVAEAPNVDFEPLFAAYVDALAKVDSRAPLSTVKKRAAAVHTLGHELAVNLSNRTYGAPVLLQPRIAKRVELALTIIQDRALQKALGVSSPAGLVEAVALERLKTKVDAKPALRRARIGGSILRELTQPAPSKGGKASETAGSARRRAPRSARKLKRLLAADAAQPHGQASPKHDAVFSLCLTKAGKLTPCQQSED